jgi:hypothetical protein
LTFSLVLALLVLPVESILVPVARTPDQRAAAAQWAATLSAADAQQASDQIEDYPAVYRRALMGVLGPDNRALVWRAHFRKYLRTHPDLTPAQVALIQDAIDVASPGARSRRRSPTRSRSASARSSSRRRRCSGPRTRRISSSTSDRRTAQERAVGRPAGRRSRAHVARRLGRVPDCNCNIDIDTCDLVPDPWLECSELYTCNFDLDWPMCGPLWSWACTGGARSSVGRRNVARAARGHDDET